MTSVVVALVVALAGGAASAEAPAPADRAAAVAHDVIDGRFQRQLPIRLGPAGRRPGRDGAGATPGRAPAAPPRRAADRPSDEGGGGALGVVASVLMYGLLGVGLAMLFLWLVSDLRRGSDAVSLPGDESAAAEVDLAVIARPLDDADQLARGGRYADAIHTLLLRTLVELVRATRTRVPASLTSREILDRVPLIPDARVALHGLVAAVERTHFGEAEAGADDYQRCKVEFERFALAYRGGGA